MISEEFKNSLNKFLEKETYIVAYRSNYDSARQFNNELIDYIKDLQQENEELKDKIEKTIDYINKIELDNYDIYTANILLDRNDGLLEILKGE